MSSHHYVTWPALAGDTVQNTVPGQSVALLLIHLRQPQLPFYLYAKVWSKRRRQGLVVRMGAIREFMTARSEP